MQESPQRITTLETVALELPLPALPDRATSLATPTPAKHLPPTPPDLPQIRELLPTLPAAILAMVTQDLLVQTTTQAMATAIQGLLTILPTVPATEVATLTQDLPTVTPALPTTIQDPLTILPTVPATEAATPTQDLPTVAPALPTAIQDPLIVLPAAQAIEAAAVLTQDLPTVAVLPAEVTQAQAVQDLAEEVIQEAAVQAEDPTQVAEALEEMPHQAEDKFRIQNPKFKSISKRDAFFIMDLRRIKKTRIFACLYVRNDDSTDHSISLWNTFSSDADGQTMAYHSENQPYGHPVCDWFGGR